MVGHQRRNNTMRVGGSQVIPRPNNYRTIDHNPFTNLDTRALQSLDAVSAAVKAFKPDQILRQPLENARPSAVLVGLFETSRGVEAILTRRSQEMTNHRGEISFPGGRLDAGETVVDAALRETHEEIGLLPSDARVVGELNGMATVVSNSHIVPIVARYASAPKFRAVNSEVDRVFSVPLLELTQKDTYSQEHWVFSDREFQINFFYLDDETIWGATARILFQVMMLAVKHK
ncbi:MAG: CoA pyrophosphatase [Actinobacteria bacterium]|nr:CoA pyrophosphatase [Actinomycetota bacterium]NBY60930.1 CoA pyrophosphatase [Actinomycetota bacterium]NCU87619.1 CoA pyrophosphatase [Actinomycetota bacterium]NDA97501.1 CoA pyrophosphatase [Actinomycetota bacterium]NDF67690.1 CoA pyrophosphatase [Actinomycetota bacterium]